MNPDALFGVKDSDKPEGQNTTYFFLEIVGSRESEYERQQSYFMRKMEPYSAYHRQGKHTARRGISNFRVITVRDAGYGFAKSISETPTASTLGTILNSTGIRGIQLEVRQTV